MKTIKIILVSLAVLITMVIVGFVIWALTPLGPMPEALAALESRDGVIVKINDWYDFSPEGDEPDTGFIIYPGGRVDPRSYAPLARLLALHGYRAIIVPMPLNLAVFAPGKAAEVISAYPNITSWSIGGHSLGGAMAANFASAQQSMVKGLILMAAYPAKSDDLSETGLEVASIYGTLDGVASIESILGAKQILPGSTKWVEIVGGNHAQFGWYGDQPGDLPANITREEQQNQVLEAILDQLMLFTGSQAAPIETGSIFQIPLLQANLCFTIRDSYPNNLGYIDYQVRKSLNS